MQIDAGTHVDLFHHVLRFMQHACEPSVAMRGGSLWALQDLGRGEELTLDYNASELRLQGEEGLQGKGPGAIFKCTCGSTTCVGEVRGWAYLSEEQRAARRDRCQPWLLTHS